MSPPSKTTPTPTVNWQLIADEFKVMQQYSCHDGKAGLSLKDVKYFKKTNPELFEEMVDGYSQLTGPPKLSARNFLDGFIGQGIRNFSAAVIKMVGPALGGWAVGRTINEERNPVVLGIFYHFDQSDAPIPGNSLDRIKQSLEKSFEKNGIPIKVRFTIMTDAIKLDFPTGPCKKTSQKIPNV